MANLEQSMNPKAVSIAQACEDHWETHKDDCSGFVRAVAGDFNIQLDGDANAIVDKISSMPWIEAKSGNEAASKAAEGYFVVGGLRAEGHGHVVVVVKGPLNRNKYPTAYWGRYKSVGKKNSTVNWSWNETDRDKVTYCYRTCAE